MANKRGFLNSIVDRSLGWCLGLPSERCDYHVTRAVRIPMRDGINLVGDLYEPLLPLGAKSAPVLLTQGCYGRGFIMALINARFFASRNYTVLLVSTRGTFGSEGDFEPFRTEQRDGQDIVEWMRRQTWYPGSFATCGASYLGYAQWALLHDPPADCVGACIPVGPHNYAIHHWGTGSFRLDRVGWGDMVALQDSSSLRFLPPTSRLDSDEIFAKSTFMALPLGDSIKRHLDGRAPWVSDAMAHPDPNDPYWEPLQHDEALERINIPVFLISGWYDTFTEQTLQQYTRLRDRDCIVYLTIGPWVHKRASGVLSMPAIMKFLDHHVSSAQTTHNAPLVRIFVTGAEEWRSLPSWPPPTQECTFYLHGDQTIDMKERPEDSRSCSFGFNPNDPTPTIGGPLQFGGGRVDDSEYGTRSDVLVYTSGPLEEDMEVLGKPVVELAHSSDTPFVDVWIRLSEVDKRGISHNITEAYRSLDAPRDASETLHMELRDCAHRFTKGTRIRIIIAGGSLPQYARNLGSGESRITGSTTRLACHTIAHAEGRTKILLPRPT
ncbi:Cocaine esterase-like protein [Cladobotryum mycophilum]|uniref:Cocaine esterase-like protein n=1 Tax=Cladobotryum mycophilum TaxID=491253 RepID=A0ABR0SR86_9HYPO